MITPARRLGPFTRDWWRVDMLPPNHQIPQHCFNRHGFIINKETGTLLMDTLSRARTMQFRNDDIFQTGIMRQTVILHSCIKGKPTALKKAVTHQ